MTIKRRPRRKGGRPKGRAEEKYIGIRTLFSPSNFDSFINDERYDQTLKMALRKEFGEKIISAPEMIEIIKNTPAWRTLEIEELSDKNRIPINSFKNKEEN